MENYLTIIFAAGLSRRMGQPKGLLKVGDKSWLAVQLENLLKVGFTRVVIVLNDRDKAHYFSELPRLKESVEKWFIFQKNLNHITLINEAPENGFFSSIQIAAQFLSQQNPKNVTGIFILPVDVPCPNKEVWHSLTDKMEGKKEVCLPGFLGKNGHPVLLSLGFILKLQCLDISSEDSRLDRQIALLPKEAKIAVAVTDKKICLNLNTPEKWQDYLKEHPYG